MELRDSQSVHVKNFHFSQADLASAYESERRGQFYAQRLALRIRTCPQKVQDVISGLLGRGNQDWNVVVLSKELGRQVRQYQIVLRST